MPPSVETNVLFELKAPTITCPSFETLNAEQAPETPVTLVRAASPTFHFFKPELVAIQTKLSTSFDSTSVLAVVPGILAHVAPASVEYQTPFPGAHPS